ncbi:hypothetical protein JCM8547_006285 [Rhodosporidiobolus lusitaniae]
MAPAAGPQKVLVTGAPAHPLSAYLTKIATLHSKHSFNLVLALDLFTNTRDDDDDLARLLRGDIKVPVQVYATQGEGKLPDKVREKVDAGEEVAANLSVLPKAGLLTLSSGLRLATLSGTPSASDISTLLTACTPSAPPNSSLPAPPPKPADILLTSLCPSSLALQSTKPLTPLEGREPTDVFSPQLDAAAKAARAKYHFFSAPGVFYEREPFVWPALSGAAAGEQRSFCRALGLGEMGNKTKERAFYAFTLAPSSAPTAPTSYTPSPFHSALQSSASSAASTLNGTSGPRGLKRPAPVSAEELMKAGEEGEGGVNEMGVPNYIFGGQEGNRGKRGRNGENAGGKGGPPPEHYTCHLCQQKGHWIQDCPEKAQRDAEREKGRMQRNEGAARASQKPISPDECWFCLSNPSVTKHLIASIGSETYLTLPKGQVCSTDSSPVPGGGHVMIIPISHYPTLHSIPSDLAPPVLSEVELYKQALQKCYASFGAEMVAFEVARAGGRGGHAHVQICPIPRSLASEAHSTFLTQGSKANLTFHDIPDVAAFYSDAENDTEHPANRDYLKVDLPGGKSLVHWIERGVPFSLQFGRETLALLLHAPERADWKQCTVPQEQEKRDTQAFKKAFAAFDPST